MYFIRVSWKCIANVEMEAEGGEGREESEGGVGACRPTVDPALTCLTPSDTSGLTFYLYNSRVGQLRGPLTDT